MITLDYFIINHIVNNVVNEILKNESQRIQYIIEKEGAIPQSNYITEITTFDKNISLLDRFSDTLVYEVYSNKLIPYRTYEFAALIDSKQHKVTIRHILLETNKLILWVFISTALMLIFLALGLFFVNQKISVRTWKPFFRNLSILKDYDVTKKNPVQFESCSISEFETLFEVVKTLINQVEESFHNLKEFNENISHEMQTPLAIIRNKMVLLLESQSFDEKEVQWIQSAYQEVNKLSKIGKSLTLISRIENREFRRLDSIDLSDILDNIILNMEEILEFKNIKMTVELNPAKVKCDSILANILFTNFLKNAIQHNQEGGYIKIVLNIEKFEIENSGEEMEIDKAQLFNRFYRGNKSNNPLGLGLGLAINQKICELYGFRLNYDYHEGVHKLTLFF
jgi:signal transduction histidine kinase